MAKVPHCLPCKNEIVATPTDAGVILLLAMWSVF